MAALLAILDEAFERPPGKWHHFTDASPDSGYFGTLAELPHSHACRPVTGTSVADQVSHVAFLMNASARSLRGDSRSPSQEQWQASWATVELDEHTWGRLRDELRDAYGGLRDAIRSADFVNTEALEIAIGVVAHVAYHLGATKQKLAVLDRAG